MSLIHNVINCRQYMSTNELQCATLVLRNVVAYYTAANLNANSLSKANNILKRSLRIFIAIMCDDSINASPTANNRNSIHSLRRRRKNKRKWLNSNIKNHTNVDLCKTNEINDMQLNETLDVLDVTNIFSYATLLAEADRLDCAQARQEIVHRCKLTSTQGFVTLDKLILSQENNANKSLEPLSCAQTQFGITNTELFDFCNEVEEEYVKETAAHTKTSKSIATIIFEDFCASPSYNAESEFDDDVEILEPYFYYRNAKIRTYSRRCNAESNYPSDNEYHISESSSSLSVQEDTTNTQVSYHTEVDQNCSDKLCENLLNLSAFFSQPTDANVSVIDLNTTYLKTSVEEDAINLKIFSEELLVAKFNDVECLTEDKLIYDVEHQFSLDEDWTFGDYHWFTEEVSNKLDEDTVNVIILLHELGYTLTDYDLPSEEPTANCDNKSSDNIDEPIFNKSIEDWTDDCEYFINYKTQDVLPVQETNCNNLQSFQPATNKEKTEQLPQNTIQDLGMKSKVNAKEDLKLSPNNNQKDDWYEDNDFFASFNTEDFLPSKQKTLQKEVNVAKIDIEAHTDLEVKENMKDKCIPASEGATKQFAQISGKLPNIGEINDHINAYNLENQLLEKSKNYMLNNLPVETIKINVGSPTDSSKSIKMSEQAMEYTEKIPEKVPKKNENNVANVYGINNEMCKSTTVPGNNELENQMMRKSVNAVRNKLHDGNILFNSFRTASSKSIKISNKAMKRAAQILEEVPGTELKNAVSDDIGLGSKLMEKSTNVLLTDQSSKIKDFHSASSKSTKILEEAMKIAAQILEEVEENDRLTNGMDVNKINNEILESKTVCNDNINVCELENKQVKKSTSALLNNFYDENNLFKGFRTASSKSIKISEEAIKYAEQILDSVSENDQIEIPVVDEMQTNPTTLDTKISATKLENNKMVKKSITGLPDDENNKVKSIRAVSSKSKVFDEAIKYAAQIIEELPENHEFENAVDDALLKTPIALDDKSNAFELENKLVKRSTGLFNNNSNCKIFEGFRTASLKSIKISDVAIKRAEQLLAERPEIVEINDRQSLDDQHHLSNKDAFVNKVTEQNLKEIQNFKESKRLAESILTDLTPSKLPTTSKQCIFQTDANESHIEVSNRIDESLERTTNVKCTQSQPEPDIENLRQNNEISVGKRKSADDIIQTPLRSTKILRKCNTLHNIKTAADGKHIDSTLTELAKRSPLGRCATSLIITRKNLLSLSKRRKMRQNIENDGCNEKTPNRSRQSLSAAYVERKIECTPNQEDEIFEANMLITSTPQQLKNKNELDVDFEHINWESNNDSTAMTAVGNCSKISNTMCDTAKVVPSPKERIERLCVYGDPPAIPPICTTSRSICRGPGLRRSTRRRIPKKFD